MIYASARLASIGARLFVSLFIAFGALLAASFMPTAIPSAGATVQLFECAQGAMPFPVSVDSGAKLGWIYDEPNPPTTDKRDDDSPTAHTGIDIRLKLGTPIYATGTGTIERRTDSATHVWYPDVVVSFPNGTTVKGIDVYIAHMTSVTNPGTVERGDVIGYSSGSNGLN
ncbi:MAG TPA: M23 family metallopeptidase, partial [Nitrolancea sp.]|nr:M23 family metallopeptidase [Nitrolancea sp.]